MSKNEKRVFVRIHYGQHVPLFLFFFPCCLESIIMLHVYALVFHRFEDAIPDFESVLKLNKDIACAHVNLGLIYMNHYENYHR